MTSQLSSKAVICTAHLMLAQNPKAYMSPRDWVAYLCLVRDWCEVQEIGGVKYYFHPGEGDLEPRGRTH